MKIKLPKIKIKIKIKQDAVVHITKEVIAFEM